MNNWKDLYWGDLITLEYGKPCPNYADNIGEYPVFGTNGKIGQSKKALCNHPSVIIGRKGAYRGVHYSDKPFWVIDTAFYLEPKVDIDLKWAYYNLLTQDINGMDSGSAIPSTSRQDFYFLSVKLPPLSEQKAIAHILSSFDDKIELNRQMNETLEAMARAIFKSWFVDFDPVSAKRSGRQPAGMDTATADLFPDEFEESSLGLIPKGWRVGTIETECKLIMGQSPKSEFYNTTGDGLPFHQGVTNFGVRFPTHKTFCSVSERIANKGDILFSVRAPVGRINIADKKLIIGRGLAAIKHNQDHQSFLLYHLVHTFKKEDSIGTGTIFASVTRKELQEVKLIAPKDLIVKVFDAKIQIIDKMIAENEQQSYTLATLRDTLLPKLMSGEIRVKEAEKIMEKLT
ncbi:MAG: restriction endonuclease subunit S [Dolichospermum sp.]|jgi:type I restriction enzyme S subunit